MNDRYQRALNKIIKSSCPNCHDENGCAACSIEKICNATAKDWVDTIQELIDQNKVYTLEECKKMWEEAEYEWKRKSYIHIKHSLDEDDFYNEICINPKTKSYFKRYDFITSEEHELITKTIKALEKEE